MHNGSKAGTSEQPAQGRSELIPLAGLGLLLLSVPVVLCGVAWPPLYTIAMWMEAAGAVVFCVGGLVWR